MKPAVIIPFMGMDPVRVQNLQAVQHHYQRHFDMFMGSGATIGEARNNGAFKAIKAGYDWLFFVDADIIIPVKNILQAVKVALVTGSGVYPYGGMIRMSVAERKTFIERGSLPSHSSGLPEGGALILSREGFVNICGYPEIDFGEDNILHNAMRCLLGPISRIWEPGYHLWHPAGNSNFQETRILQVVQKTEAAHDDPEMMRNLIKKAGYHDIPRFSAAGYRP